MSDQQTQNNNENYEMPTTDMSDVGKDNPVNGSNISTIIDATGKLDPSKFWMVAMVILTIALGSILFFGGGYLIKELDKKELKIDDLEKKLAACPEETLAKIKKQQLEFQDLKHIIKRDSVRIDSVILSKKNKIQKMQKIEQNL